MAIAKSAVILILCFALANYADAAPREKQVASPDIFMGKNVAQDVLLPGEKLVDVTSFGAKPDGETDSTQAFMDAWQTTCRTNKEQSRMYVPAGRFLVSPIIFAGPCLSPNPITIQVVGTVLASTDISEYSEGTWLQFEHIDGLKIIGGGSFDGQGQSSWNIGSLGKFPDELEVKGIIVKNCTMIGTTNGLRIKSWPELYPGAASDISFTDIVMENVKNPVIIDQEYECYPNCQKKPSLVKIANVHFANIRGTTISPIAVDLRCSQLNPCQGVTIQNINLKLSGGIPTSSRCQFARPVFGGFLFPPACSL
ncbi:unnamed protein product [Lupinus luteus]|uniref:Polygalacturonase n=1 Tax=Lupinus luteus TaxID=3873 RepID=A0AAV1XV26_LUPLU